MLRSESNSRAQLVRLLKGLWGYYTFISIIFSTHLPYCIFYSLMDRLHALSVRLTKQWHCQPSEVIESCLRAFSAKQTLAQFKQFGSAIHKGMCNPNASEALPYPESFNMAKYWLGHSLNPALQNRIIKEKFVECVKSKLNFNDYYASVILKSLTNCFSSFFLSMLYDVLYAAYYQCPHIAGHLFVKSCRYSCYICIEAMFLLMVPADYPDWRRLALSSLATTFFITFFGPSLDHSCSQGVQIFAREDVVNNENGQGWWQQQQEQQEQIQVQGGI